MHVFTLITGQLDKVNRMLEDLQAQYFDYKANPHDPPIKLQLGVKPVLLYQFTFPKEHYDEVMRTLEADVLNIKSSGIMRKGLSILFKIKRLFGLKSCPEWNKKGSKRIIQKQFVMVKAFGIKDDKEAKVELI